MSVAACPAAGDPVHSDAQDWTALRAAHNVFTLRAALAGDVELSAGVRALADGYVAIASRDFLAASDHLARAKGVADVEGDTRFAAEILSVERELMREQGRYDALALSLAGDRDANPISQRAARYRADTPFNAFILTPAFSLLNISPDNNRIIVSAMLGGTEGTLLFDTGAEDTLLSHDYARVYGVQGSGLVYHSNTVDGVRATELSRLGSLRLGPAQFGAVPVGVQHQKNGVIGFFLTEGATGILGFPIISRFGRIDFSVSGERVERVTLHSPAGPVSPREHANVSLRADKPWIAVSIGADTYSCIFDSGAPRSHISEAMYERHRVALGLELAEEQGDEVRRLPVRVGERELVLSSVTVHAEVRVDDRFCLIGLDAVIGAGGAVLDLDNLQIRFGPPDAPASEVFSLR